MTTTTTGTDVESIILGDYEGVTITAQRFIVGNTTYAIRHIVSVTTDVVHDLRNSDRLALCIVPWLGLILVYVLTSERLGDLAPLAGLALLVAAFMVWVLAGTIIKPTSTYRVIIDITSGKTKTLSSSDKEFATVVYKALTKAMIHSR